MSDEVNLAHEQEQDGSTGDATQSETSAEVTPVEVTQSETSAEVTPAEAEPTAEAGTAVLSDEEPAVEDFTGDEAESDDDRSDDDRSDDVDSITVADESMGEGGKRNVRVLHVGQQITGKVKRVAEFGAFVDIGVGRDGLIHISELSVRRVGKVNDVLAEGQEITAWIKKLDRERNRISLTLIDPATRTIRDLEKGEVVQGTVTRILPYGAFVDIGIGRDALLHVREMGEGFVAKPEDVVKVGDSIEARIIELSRRRGRVDLSLKGLRPEPEQPAQQYQDSRQQGRSSRQPEPEPEPEVEQVEDVEVLSPMELAFKRAMEAEGMEFKPGKGKRDKRGRKERTHDMQEDIISRTLNSGRK
jgi:small subunit ribosomal protein S1